MAAALQQVVMLDRKNIGDVFVDFGFRKIWCEKTLHFKRNAFPCVSPAL